MAAAAVGRQPEVAPVLGGAAGDERLAEDLLDRQPRVSGQRRGARRGQDARLAEQRLHRQPGLRTQRQPDERDVDRPVRQTEVRVAEVVLAHLDVDVLVRSPERRQRLRRQLPRRVGQEADDQTRACAVRRVAGAVHRAVRARQQPPALLEEHPPRRRQLDVPGRPREQADVQHALELADLNRERRLGDVQAPSGVAEVQLLGHGDEVPQQPQVQVTAHPLPAR